MAHVSENQFVEAVRSYVGEHGPCYVKAVEDGLRANGMSSSSGRIKAAVARRHSGLLLTRVGIRSRVSLREPVNGETDVIGPGPVVSEPPSAGIQSRAAAFGDAVSLLTGSLPRGCKLTLTVELNEEAPF